MIFFPPVILPSAWTDPEINSPGRVYPRRFSFPRFLPGATLPIIGNYDNLSEAAMNPVQTAFRISLYHNCVHSYGIFRKFDSRVLDARESSDIMIREKTLRVRRLFRRGTETGTAQKVCTHLSIICSNTALHTEYVNPLILTSPVQGLNSKKCSPHSLYYWAQPF